MALAISECQNGALWIVSRDPRRTIVSCSGLRRESPLATLSGFSVRGPSSCPQTLPFPAVFRREASSILSFQRVASRKRQKIRALVHAGGGAFEEQRRRLDFIDESRFGREKGLRWRPL
jgi:hypothetical protein